MRRVAARLAGLALVTGLAAIVSTAGAAPPDGSKPVSRQPTADELPNPAEEKRRELRQVALQDVIQGKANVQQRGASKVVKVGQTAAPGAQAEDQYVELAPVRRARPREDGQDLRDPGRVR
jgi:immune inhibitor A